MKHFRTAVVVTCVLTFVGAVYVAQREASAAAEEDTATLMEIKLENAEQILRGVALRDFGAIKMGAQHLHLLSEEAEWTVPLDPVYGMFGDRFRETLIGLEEQAEDENLEGVTLHFFQVVMACVQCHDIVRERSGLAFLDDSPEDLLSGLLNPRL